MSIYTFLEKPKIYNFIEKILSLGNKSCENCLLELIKSREDNLILDVGCGTARYNGLLAGHYYGVDINPDYISYAQKHCRGSLSVMDGASLNFPDNMFDFVFNVGVLHHVADEKATAIVDEMKRVCRPGGEVFIIEAVYPSKFNFIGYLLFKFDRGKYTRTANQLKSLLTSRGLGLLQDDIKRSYPYKLCVFFYQKE